MMFKKASVTLLSQIRNDTENKNVVSLDLNVDKVRDYVTSGSRLFHVVAVATRNAWSPMIRSCVNSTATAELYITFYFIAILCFEKDTQSLLKNISCN